MAERTNATCAICGEKYYVCNTCRSTKQLKPWRTITDSIECYKIYMIIHNYTNGLITKEKARKMLEDCTLPLKTQSHIKAVIDEITEPDKKVKQETKKGAENNNLRNNE